MFPWSTENIEQWTKMQKNNWLCWSFCSMCQVFVFQDNFQIIQGVVSFAGLLKKICQKTIYLLNAHSKQFALFSDAFAWQGARRITSYILVEKKSCDLSVESALGSGRCLLAHLSGDAGAGAGGAGGGGARAGGAAGGDEEQEHQEHLHTRFLYYSCSCSHYSYSCFGWWWARWLLTNATPAGTNLRVHSKNKQKSNNAGGKCYTSWQPSNKSIWDGKSDNIIPSKCNTSILGGKSGKSHNLQQPTNKKRAIEWYFNLWCFWKTLVQTKDEESNRVIFEQTREVIFALTDHQIERPGKCVWPSCLLNQVNQKKMKM